MDGNKPFEEAKQFMDMLMTFSNLNNTVFGGHAMVTE
jgi:hypothetical protein